MKLREYQQQSRDLTLSFFFIGPLLAFYEIGSLSLQTEVRNGADVLLRSLFGIFGGTGVTIFNILLLGGCVVAGIQVFRRDRPIFYLLPAVLAEAALLSIFFAPTVLVLESRLLPYLAMQAPTQNSPLFTHLVLSAGAGVYEEILFRLILVGACFAWLHRVLRFKKLAAGIISVVVSSILFSAFHHIGVYGEPFEMHAFLFRLIAGVLLASIFLLRGLAVAVYTHTFYDVLVFLKHSG